MGRYSAVRVLAELKFGSNKCLVIVAGSRKELEGKNLEGRASWLNRLGVLGSD